MDNQNAERSKQAMSQSRKWGERIRAHSNYQLVFLLIVTSFAFTFIGNNNNSWWRLSNICISGCTLLLALVISNVAKRTMRLALITYVLFLLIAFAIEISHISYGSWLLTAQVTLLLFLTAFCIGKRLATFMVITQQEIWGALCIYVLIGVFFAYLDHTVSKFLPTPYFATQSNATLKDFLYFSFATMTTVGYGDFTPIGDIPRVLAIIEALAGQLYLVTVVAVMVGGFSTLRHRQPPRS